MISDEQIRVVMSELGKRGKGASKRRSLETLRKAQAAGVASRRAKKASAAKTAQS